MVFASTEAGSIDGRAEALFSLGRSVRDLVDLMNADSAAHPDNADAQVQYGYALLALGRVEEARKVVESRSAETRRHPLVLSIEARIAASEGGDGATVVELQGATR